MSTLLTTSNEFSWAMVSLSWCDRSQSAGLNPPADRPSECLAPGAPLSVSHVRPEAKQPEEVFRGRGGDFFLVNPQNLGQNQRCLQDPGRLVALAAAGRSEERRVGKECKSRASPHHQ